MCGKGHSYGNAWCNHCANSLPCKGTCPSLCSAMLFNLDAKSADTSLGSSIDELVMLPTKRTICSGVVVGDRMLPSSSFNKPSHSFRQQIE